MTPNSPRSITHWPLAFLLAFFALSIGGALTTTGEWYASLQRPWFQPPDWAFPVAWTALFALMAVAGVWGWRDAPTAAHRNRLMLLWALNAGLNVTWSLLYFTLQRPDLAMVEILVLWVSVLLLVRTPAAYSRRASVASIPYLAWVTLAVALNAATLILNPQVW